MPNFYNLLRARKFTTVADTAIELGISTGATPNFTVDAGGKLSWGSGSAPVDSNLYRPTATPNMLKTDTGFIVGGNLIVSGTSSLVGTPTAPTATTDTNTTQIATTAFVIGQASLNTPTYISQYSTIGSGTTFARADHVHGMNGVSWVGNAVAPAYGGTGVANGANNTITFTGNFTLGLTLSGNTSVTLPTSGTIATTSNKLSAFAATTSAELAGVISDETGSGALVFGTSPSITTSLTTGSASFSLINTTATSVNFAGAATTLIMGAPGGTTTINGALSGATPSFTGPLSVTGVSTFNNRIDVGPIRESVTTTTISTNVITQPYTSGTVLFQATTPSANFTINLTGVPTDNDKVITITIFVTQGVVAYIPSAIQVDGFLISSLKWANGGTAPTPTPSKIDIFSFALVRRSSAWIAYGSSTLNY